MKPNATGRPTACRPVLSLRFKPALRAGRHHMQAAPPFGADALQGGEPG